MRLSILALLALPIILYLPASRIGFLYDDFPHFVENPQVRHPNSPKDIFKNGRQETRPVYNASLALQSAVFGASPVAAHVVNVALHVTVGLLFFVFLSQLLGASWIPFWAALFFLVHPIAVESVAYFNSRSGILAVLFSILGWISLRRRTRMGLSMGVLCLALAIGSKEDGIAGVGIALLLELWATRPALNWRRVLAIGASTLTLPILYLVFRSPHVDTVGTSVEPWTMYLFRQGAIIPLHLSEFLWPWPLTLDRDLGPEFQGVLINLTGWVLLCIVTWVVWRRRSAVWTLAVAWLAITFAPTHSVVPLLDVHATRILYFPLTGMALLAACGLDTVSRKRKGLATAIGVAASIFFSLRTHAQIDLWRDPLEFWRRNTVEAPSRWRSWTNYGIELAERKRWTEAWEAVMRAEAIAPKEPQVLYNAAAISAVREDGLRDLSGAAAKLETALVLDPSHARSKRLLSRIRSGELR